MAYAIIGLALGGTLIIGGFRLYVQLYRQKLGWTKSLREKVNAATRNRISHLLSEHGGDGRTLPSPSVSDTGPL